MSTGTEDPVADKRGPVSTKLNAMVADSLQPSAMNRSEKIDADSARPGQAVAASRGTPK